MALYLTEDDVEALLPMEAALEAVEGSFHRQASGVIENKPRYAFPWRAGSSRSRRRRIVD